MATLADWWAWEQANPADARRTIQSSHDRPRPVPRADHTRPNNRPTFIGRTKTPRIPQGRTCGHIATYNSGCHCPDCKQAAADSKWRYRRRTGRYKGVRRRDWVIDYRLGRST